MRVLVAMSGGVDSSVAAALLRADGHEVVGATLKLWGGEGDSGCCSLADVTDARRVADRLGIEHFVFNLTEEFERDVVAPYVAAHARAQTPNPCVECNRHIKFGRLLGRAHRLGFDALATGHHARVVRDAHGNAELRRGHDAAKDQSYVLAVLGAGELSSVLLPIGALDKDEVRGLARRLGLRVADKPDSQDVCFIASRTPGAGRQRFLAERIALHSATVHDARDGSRLGEVEALELLTIGQRRGLDIATGDRRYVVEVDPQARRVVLGDEEDLMTDRVVFAERTWTATALAPGSEVLVQTSAHGRARAARLTDDGVAYLAPARRVAPGQVVALYREEVVVGSGIAQ